MSNNFYASPIYDNDKEKNTKNDYDTYIANKSDITRDEIIQILTTKKLPDRFIKVKAVNNLQECISTTKKKKHSLFSVIDNEGKNIDNEGKNIDNEEKSIDNDTSYETKSYVFTLLRTLNWQDVDDAKMGMRDLQKLSKNELRILYTVMLILSVPLITSLKTNPMINHHIEKNKDEYEIAFHIISKGKTVYNGVLRDPSFAEYMLTQHQGLYGLISDHISDHISNH